MATAATVSYPEITSIIHQLPRYEDYASTREAAEAEREYRFALGRMLKECGDQLLAVVERQPQLITGEQHDTIDALIDAITGIFKRLNRQGAIRLPNDRRAAIRELEEIDLRLILLLEEALTLVGKLSRDARASSWFHCEATRLSRDLVAFGAAAEERNYLLGLGWESEFRVRGRRG